MILAWEGNWSGYPFEGIAVFDAAMSGRIDELMMPPEFIHDIDGDGREEIAIAWASGFQVWGYPQGSGMWDPGDGEGAPPRIRCLPAGNPTGGEVRFAIEAGRPISIDATIHDLNGRVVGELGTQTLPSGTSEITWDGRDRNGVRVPSGAYFLSLREKDGRTTTRITVVR